jgi:LemA protein
MATELESQLRQEGYTDAEAQEIVRRAMRLQADAGSRTSEANLESSAAEVGVSREWVQEAARQIRGERAAVRSRSSTMQKVGIGAVVLVALALWGSYNTLNSARTQVEAARAQLENVLQRRFDLIPQLVKVTREYAGHERAVFDALAAARARWQNAGSLAEKQAANAQLEQALPRIQALVESNPQLKASDLYLRLQDELSGTENRIAVERRRYNEAVADYNRRARSFPMLLVRPLFGFPAQEPYFQAAPEAHQPPQF